MESNTSRNPERAVLEFIATISRTYDLKALLRAIADRLWFFLDIKDCWIYLQPEFVPEYNGVLLRDNKVLNESEVTGAFDDFVVLANTSEISAQPFIGKAFFGNGEGITGWVYKNGTPLIIKDVSNAEELVSISPEIHYLNQFDNSAKIDSAESKQSILILPLIVDDVPIGTFELHKTTKEDPFFINKNPFSHESTQLAIIVSQIISGQLASATTNLRIEKRVGQLLMSLAHEIDTPLAGILAESENLAQEELENPKYQNNVQRIVEQVLRIQMQTSTIMAVISRKIPSRGFTVHSIYRPVKEACDLFRAEAKFKGCDILEPIARDGNFPSIEMSLFDLAIAFKNIIHNAVKYSYKPPANLETHRTIKIWGQRDTQHRNYYTVYIQNYGVGISSAEIEKGLIFKEFYRGQNASDRRRTGAGFGLAHARIVIEGLHKGFIGVTSIPVEGGAYLTTFAVSLPIKQSEAVRSKI